MKFLAALVIGWMASSALLAEEIARSPHCPDSVGLAVSPAFVLCLPLDFYRNALVVSADDLLVKRADGSAFFAKVIDPEMDDLPSDFDMRDYPKYLLGLTETGSAFNALPVPIQAKFSTTREVLEERLDFSAATITRSDDRTVYLIPGPSGAEVYIAKHQRPDQILLISFREVDTPTIHSIIKGLR